MNNRAAKYGDGLFETLRISRGKILFAAAHYSRLSKGFLALDFCQTKLFYDDFLTILAAYIPTKSDANLRIRITFFRLGEGLYTPKGQDFDYFVETTPLDSPFYKLNTQGLCIGIATQVKLTIDTLSNLKTISALPYILAGIEKKKNNWDDCLLLNYKENISESIAANVFIYQEGSLFTPALSEGCIAGIMRQQIIKIAQKNSIPIIEKELTLEDLATAESVFLTNAIQGIRWVKKIVGFSRKYNSDIAVFLSRKLFFSHK